MVYEWLAPHLDMLIGRTDGPMALRFVLQPTVAVILAIRAGLRDARAGRPPFFFLPAFVSWSRGRDLLRLASEDVGKVFIVAFLLDLVYTLLLHRRVYPIQSLIVAFALAILPYLLIRGGVTRIARLVRPC